MTRAMINAWQSTYDDDGNDLGWGKDSVNIQVKHIMSEGAGEGGREAHTLDGAYAVYPGGQFYTSILPYFAAQDLPGKTGMVSSAMTSFSIAWMKTATPSWASAFQPATTPKRSTACGALPTAGTATS